MVAISDRRMNRLAQTMIREGVIPFGNRERILAAMELCAEYPPHRPLCHRPEIRAHYEHLVAPIDPIDRILGCTPIIFW